MASRLSRPCDPATVVALVGAEASLDARDADASLDHGVESE
ncbi:hypothetical protein [Haloarcula sp. CBA1131]|nr:hypothetical protein [Haloarcula sp. CBA1131]